MNADALMLKLLPVMLIEAIVAVALAIIGLTLMVGVQAGDILRRWRNGRVWVGGLRPLSHLTIRVEGLRVMRFRSWLSSLLFRLAAWVVGATVAIEEAGDGEPPVEVEAARPLAA